MISVSFAANDDCFVIVVTIFVERPDVIMALVYDIVVFVFVEDAIWAAAIDCARFSAVGKLSDFLPIIFLFFSITTNVFFTSFLFNVQW